MTRSTRESAWNAETRSYLTHDLLHYAIEAEAGIPERVSWGRLAGGDTHCRPERPRPSPWPRRSAVTEQQIDGASPPAVKANRPRRWLPEMKEIRSFPRHHHARLAHRGVSWSPCRTWSAQAPGTMEPQPPTAPRWSCLGRPEIAMGNQLSPLPLDTHGPGGWTIKRNRDRVVRQRVDWRVQGIVPVPRARRTGGKLHISIAPLLVAAFLAACSSSSPQGTKPATGALPSTSTAGSGASGSSRGGSHQRRSATAGATSAARPGFRDQRRGLPGASTGACEHRNERGIQHQGSARLCRLLSRNFRGSRREHAVHRQ